MDTAEFVDGLRDLAEFIERHGENAMPSGGWARGQYVVHRYCCDADELLALADRLGGGFIADEQPEGGYFRLTRRFGLVDFQLYTAAENVGRSRPVPTTVDRWHLNPDVMVRLADVTAVAA